MVIDIELNTIIINTRWFKDDGFLVYDGGVDDIRT